MFTQERDVISGNGSVHHFGMFSFHRVMVWCISFVIWLLSFCFVVVTCFTWSLLHLIIVFHFVKRYLFDKDLYYYEWRKIKKWWYWIWCDEIVNFLGRPVDRIFFLEEMKFIPFHIFNQSSCMFWHRSLTLWLIQDNDLTRNLKEFQKQVIWNQCISNLMTRHRNDRVDFKEI